MLQKKTNNYGWYVLIYRRYSLKFALTHILTHSPSYTRADASDPPPFDDMWKVHLFGQNSTELNSLRISPPTIPSESTLLKKRYIYYTLIQPLMLGSKTLIRGRYIKDDTLIQGRMYRYYTLIIDWSTSLVGWDCRIQRLHLNIGVRSDPQRVFWGNHWMLRLQSRSFSVCGVPLHCHYFQVHPDRNYSTC